jgi:putative copper export protein
VSVSIEAAVLLHAIAAATWVGVALTLVVGLARCGRRRD